MLASGWVQINTAGATPAGCFKARPLFIEPGGRLPASPLWWKVKVKSCYAVITFFFAQDAFLCSSPTHTLLSFLVLGPRPKIKMEVWPFPFTATSAVIVITCQLMLSFVNSNNDFESTSAFLCLCSSSFLRAPTKVSVKFSYIKRKEKNGES